MKKNSLESLDLESDLDFNLESEKSNDIDELEDDLFDFDIDTDETDTSDNSDTLDTSDDEFTDQESSETPDDEEECTPESEESEESEEESSYESDNYSPESIDNTNQSDLTSEESSKSKKRPTELYLLMDKAPMGMLTYFRDYGAKVSKIYKNIQDAEQDFVMQVGHVRLIIVDSGTGVFASTRSRAKLASLAGAIDDEKKITIFYSDSLIKYDIVNQTQYDGGINFEKDIEWFKYKSTPDLLARILKMNKKQNFTYSHNKDDEHFENVHKKNKDGEAEFLKFKGVQDLELDKMLSKHKKIDIGTPIIDVKDVERYILNDSPGIENLETFKIKT